MSAIKFNAKINKGNFEFKLANMFGKVGLLRDIAYYLATDGIKRRTFYYVDGQHVATWQSGEGRIL